MQPGGEHGLYCFRHLHRQFLLNFNKSIRLIGPANRSAVIMPIGYTFPT
jgi:hypothetical protein